MDPVKNAAVLLFLVFTAAYAVSMESFVRNAMDRLARHHQRITQNLDSDSQFKLQSTSQCTDEALQRIYSDYMLPVLEAECPTHPNEKNPDDGCSMITTEEFCSNCAGLLSALFQAVAEAHCTDLVYPSCVLHSDCDGGSVCYLGYCSAICQEDSECNQPCGGNVVQTCEIAPGSIDKVCTDPRITTHEELVNDINMRFNLFISEDFCLQNGDGMYCYDIPEIYSELNCVDMETIGCCAGMLHRGMRTCDGDALFAALQFDVDALDSLFNMCSDIDLDAECVAEVGLCPATGGTDYMDESDGGDGDGGNTTVDYVVLRQWPVNVCEQSEENEKCVLSISAIPGPRCISMSAGDQKSYVRILPPNATIADSVAQLVLYTASDCETEFLVIDLVEGCNIMAGDVQLSSEPANDCLKNYGSGALFFVPSLLLVLISMFVAMIA